MFDSNLRSKAMNKKKLQKSTVVMKIGVKKGKEETRNKKGEK